MPDSECLQCELVIIGRGMAGMAAALFAANRGLNPVQVGTSGAVIFASGLLDLLGVHPMEEKKAWRDPWAGIDTLVRDLPDHPYARLQRQDIEAAFEEVLSFLKDFGLPYKRRKNRNSEMITPLGTVKSTYCVPQTMWRGVKALEERRPCLLVDFQGLNDFSAHQIAAALRDRWGGLRAIRVPFPDNSYVREFSTGEIMAQTLELSKNRKRLIEEVRPHVKNSEAVGMPAVLGINRTREIIAELEEQIGVPVFEIPTLPVCVPGFRLNDTFTRGLSEKGVRQFYQSQVTEVRQGVGGDFVLGIANKTAKYKVETKGVILTSGRFWGGGLNADRKHIRETVFDLPVYQPSSRNDWHREDFLDPRGHPANQAGLEIDDEFRPLDTAGRPAFATLFAAGSILAHQDWMRMKCGSGLAIATAYAAVNAFLKSTGRGT
jgi:glycerol-3-phosphate dehydrogenase subunit B